MRPFPLRALCASAVLPLLGCFVACCFGGFSPEAPLFFTLLQRLARLRRASTPKPILPAFLLSRRRRSVLQEIARPIQAIPQVRAFVEAGGGLVASGDTSARDEWKRQRPDLGLREVLGPNAGRGSDPWHATRHDCAQGRAAYLSELVTEEDISRWHGLPSSAWKLPKNVHAMRQALLWAARQRLPIWLDAPETVVAEFLTQPGLGKYLVHLVNFDLSRLRHDLRINLRLPRGQRVRRGFALDPDSRRPEKLRAEREGEVTTLTIPTLEIYKLVVVETR